MKKKLLARTGILITALALLTTLHAQTKPTGHRSKKEYGIRNSYLSVENDTTVIPGQQIINYRDRQEYRIKMIDDKVIELIVDDKKIPATDFYKYDSVIKKIRKQIKKDQEMAELDMQQAVKDREQAEEDEVQARRDSEQAEEDRKMAEEEIKRSRMDQDQEEEDRRQADEDREQARADRRQAEEDRKQAIKDREQAVADRKQAAEDRALMKSLVADLVKENIIKSEKELFSLKLNDEGLSVNDKKQTESIYQKFKAKYLKNPRTEIWFSHSLNHSGLSIQTEKEKRK